MSQGWVIVLAQLTRPPPATGLFTDQYLRDPGGLGEELKAALLAAFSTPELVHLSMAVAHFSGFSRCAVSLGGMPDELPVMEISVPG